MARGKNVNFGYGKISIAFPNLQLSGCMTVCKLQSVGTLAFFSEKNGENLISQGACEDEKIYLVENLLKVVGILKC